MYVSLRAWLMMYLGLVAITVCTATKATGVYRRRGNKGGRMQQKHILDRDRQGGGRKHRINLEDECCVPDEQRLMAKLLINYEPASRPVFNASHVVTVKFGLTLTQISDMWSDCIYLYIGEEGNNEGYTGENGHMKKVKLPDEQRLLRKILYNYDTAARPVYNASNKVTVQFGFTLTQLADMDEVNQVLTTNVWLEQEWVDERLKWDPKEFNGLAILRMPCQRIWLPDIVLYNSADDFTEGFMQSKAMVSHEGNVFWPPPAKLRSSCKIDITYFPFDDQKCKMKFGSWTYDGFQVDVTNRSARVDLQNYVYSGEWELLGIKVLRNEVFYPCCMEPYPDVTFYIVMRRRTLYYLFNIIFPCLWLTILSLLGFWLPPDSGEKITLGITVLLAFSVFMLLIAESMPATSEFVPLIGIYLTVTMAMTSLSIVLTVFVLQLHHVGPNTKPVPVWIRKVVIGVIARAICMSSHLQGYYSYREPNSKKDEMCLTSFIDNLDLKETNNCNGRFNQSQLNQYGLNDTRNNGDNHRGDRNVNYDKISRHLKILVSKHDGEDEFQDIINEWRLVAHIMDRFLFWLFLIGSFLSSISILVFKPMGKPTDLLEDV